jgi:hypothetical protein
MIMSHNVSTAVSPSFLFHALTGETRIPLFGNPSKFLRSRRTIASQDQKLVDCALGVAFAWGERCRREMRVIH